MIRGTKCYIGASLLESGTYANINPSDNGGKTNHMSERKMTLKGFIKKASAAKSAIGFISQYREYMLTGELAPLTEPILVKLDNHELLPTPALKDITDVVFAHMLAQESLKAQESLEKVSSPRSPKAVTATLLSPKGNELDSKGFDLSQEAERWLDRRLVESAPGCSGKILHSKVKELTVEVSREDAFSRVYKERKMASHKKTGVSMSKLGFGVKVKNDRFHFSHG